MLLSKYRVWCNTEGMWRYTDYRETVPIVCPANEDHSIDATKSAVVSVEGSEHPHAEDLKPYVTPDLFPLGYFMVHTGRGDDVTNGVLRSGTQMTAELSAEGDAEVVVQFIHHILLAGGSVNRLNGKIDDYISMALVAPATIGISAPGVGAYSKVPAGVGINLFAPHPSSEGDWDLDLEESLNGNVAFTKAVPVPASGAGFFDYDVDTDTLTLNAGQTGSHHLLDAEKDLSYHVNEVPLLGEGKGCTTVPAVKPALCFPHWVFKTTLHHGAGTHELQVAWKFTVGRKNTV